MINPVALFKFLAVEVPTNPTWLVGVLAIASRTLYLPTILARVFAVLSGRSSWTIWIATFLACALLPRFFGAG